MVQSWEGQERGPRPEALSLCQEDWRPLAPKPPTSSLCMSRALAPRAFLVVLERSCYKSLHLPSWAALPRSPPQSTTGIHKHTGIAWVSWLEPAATETAYCHAPCLLGLSSGGCQRSAPCTEYFHTHTATHGHYRTLPKHKLYRKHQKHKTHTHSSWTADSHNRRQPHTETLYFNTPTCTTQKTKKIQLRLYHTRTTVKQHC